MNLNNLLSKHTLGTTSFSSCGSRSDGDGQVDEDGVWLGAVGSATREARDASQALLGTQLEPEAVTSAARLARKFATPLDNTDFQASGATGWSRSTPPPPSTTGRGGSRSACRRATDAARIGW